MKIPPGERADPAGRLVLVIEHDPGVAELERTYLAREGHRVVVEPDIDAAVAAVGRVRPDVVVLDISTGRSGDLFEEVAAVAAPAPVVCATRADQATPARARGVVRPFAPRVLVAAVAWALREADVGETADVGGDVLRAGAVAADTAARTVLVAGGAVALTAIEFDLLTYLMNHAGRVCTREQVLEGVWGPLPSAGARTVDVHIAQLRAKLGEASPIRTVRGIGYTIDT